MLTVFVGTVYAVMFLVTYVIRRSEIHGKESPEKAELKRDRIYSAMLGFEGFYLLILMHIFSGSEH